MTATRRISTRTRSSGGRDGSVHARGTVININRAETNTSHQLDYVDEFTLQSAGVAGTWLPPRSTSRASFSW